MPVVRELALPGFVVGEGAEDGAEQDDEEQAGDGHELPEGVAAGGVVDDDDLLDEHGEEERVDEELEGLIGEVVHAPGPDGSAVGEVSEGVEGEGHGGRMSWQG